MKRYHDALQRRFSEFKSWSACLCQRGETENTVVLETIARKGLQVRVLSLVLLITFNPLAYCVVRHPIFTACFAIAKILNVLL